MKKENLSYKNILLSATAAIAAVGGVSMPAYANPGTSDAVIIAQTATADLCRRVVNPPEGLVIRANPSTSAQRVGGVGRGERVTLTTSPATTNRDGAGRTWVQISAPNAGWISNGIGGPGFLVYCGPTPPPPPPSRCRRVINPPEGLAIKREASRTSATVGGLAQYQRFTITTSPATTSRDSEGRTWVQIEAPTAGWVSNGTGGQSNVGVCP
ncbi:MAG: SH3 domain-containing protein [Oscillatoriales cyanobacterium C42_A2020_001]|nr:SH3 domain-containing protein [Leptolyngbyaceae cyanobacterium C42_A2020_001]